jgi:hypothetical protein
VAGDEPGVVPDLDGFGGHAEAAGHLGQGEHAGVAGLLRVFRTAILVLIHAASCRFRYSSWTSCGVL